MPKSRRTSAPAWATHMVERRPFQQPPAPSVVMMKVEKEEVVMIGEEQLTHNCNQDSQVCGFHPLDSRVDRNKVTYDGTLVPPVVIKKEEGKEVAIPQGRQHTTQCANIPVACQFPCLNNPIKCEKKRLSTPTDGQRRKRMRCSREETTVRGE